MLSKMRVAFFMEQAMGNRAYTHYLQAAVSEDDTIEPNWTPVHWNESWLASRLPIYTHFWPVHFAVEGLREVSKTTREFQPDALFFRYDSIATFATPWMKRTPSIVLFDATPLQIHAMSDVYGYRPPPGWLGGWLWRASRASFLTAEILVAGSQWAKQGLIEGYGIVEERIHVIPPGVDVAQFSVQREKRSPNRPVKILIVAGQFKRKGGMLLLEAFRALRNLGVELHIVTQDQVPAEEGLFVYKDLTPISPSILRLYKESDIFCLPTFADAFPLALQEAGAAGLAIISTPIAAIPELIADGETGLLVPPGDLKALTSALRRLIEDADLSRRLGERATEVVNKNFNVKTNTALCLDLLKQRSVDRSS